MTEKKKAKKTLDLPQAIVLSVVLGTLIITAGMIVIWGPENASTQVMEYVALGVAGLGMLFAALRSKGLFSAGSGSEGDGDKS